ncbi:MAG: hypothetical protein K8T90_07535, partial [Planctomycetes bacterium]|nr:hypothetical protein [Planctomycetota bacterium]
MARKKSNRRRKFAWLWARKWDSGRTNWYATWRDPVLKKRVTRALGDNKDDAEKFLVELETRYRLRLPVGPVPTQNELRGGPAPVAADGTKLVPAFADYAHHLLEERLVGTLAEATMDLYRANLAALRGFFGSRRVTTRVRGVGVEQTIPGKRLDEI